MTALPVSMPPEESPHQESETGRELARLIGRTPLVPLRRIARGLPPDVVLLAKAEWFNPGGSIKDRPAWRMVRNGFMAGTLGRGRVLIDATSGNTGIAYAMLGAAIGFPVRLCLPANVTEERKRLLRAHGADLILTDPLQGSDGAIREARRIAAGAPHDYFYPDQYNNPANWQAHFESTGPEIWRQTRGRITHFVAGLGTSGTFIGTGRFLRRRNPTIRLASFQPDSPFHGLDGIKHMATALVPGIYDPGLADDNLEISTEGAHDMVRRLAREEGLMVGVSGGGAVLAALRVAQGLTRGTVVTILPDGGSRYLGERFWEEGS